MTPLNRCSLHCFGACWIKPLLRLLGTDLNGPDIARELMVSLHTLRTHTNHIYTKLGVNTRRAAVHRAKELGLF